jgi:hypothetical protein
MLDLLPETQIILSDGLSFTIEKREDKYINATKICKTANKKFSNWLRLKKTKRAIDELEKRLNVKVLDKQENIWWIHYELLLSFSQWCSLSLYVRMCSWITELLLTGSVEVGKEKPYYEQMKIFKQRLQKMEEIQYFKDKLCRVKEEQDVLKNIIATNMKKIQKSQTK